MKHLRAWTAVGLAMVLVGIGAGATTSKAARRAPVNPIRHVVVIFQENHSFDDVLGRFCLAVAAGTIVRSGLNKGCDGVDHAVTVAGSPALKNMPDIVPPVYHSVEAQATVIDAGKMDGWRKINGCTTSKCLAQHPAAQSTNVTALASRFALSDRTFEHSTSPSWMGHMELVAGTRDGFQGNNPTYVPGRGVPPQGGGWGCDSNRVSPYGPSLVNVPSCIPDYSLPASNYPNGGAFRLTPVAHVPTIMDRLDAAGLSWKIYSGAGRATATNKQPDGYVWSICPTFAGCLYTNQVKHLVPNKTVMTDAQSGQLPGLSIVIPNGRESQHNGSSWVAGDNWIGQVVSSIQHGPDWASTAIFITWDDCGCFYDHVNPLAFDPGWGIRVPMLIVSPYARAGYTDSTPTSYSGILAYTEHLFGLSALTGSDSTAYDFHNAFNYAQVPLAPAALVTRQVPASSLRYVAAHPPDPNDPT